MNTKKRNGILFAISTTVMFFGNSVAMEKEPDQQSSDESSSTKVSLEGLSDYFFNNQDGDYNPLNRVLNKEVAKLLSGNKKQNRPQIVLADKDQDRVCIYAANPRRINGITKIKSVSVSMYSKGKPPSGGAYPVKTTLYACYDYPKKRQPTFRHDYTLDEQNGTITIEPTKSTSKSNKITLSCSQYQMMDFYIINKIMRSAYEKWSSGNSFPLRMVPLLTASYTPNEHDYRKWSFRPDLSLKQMALCFALKEKFQHIKQPEPVNIKNHTEAYNIFCSLPLKMRNQLVETGWVNRPFVQGATDFLKTHPLATATVGTTLSGIGGLGVLKLYKKFTHS